MFARALLPLAAAVLVSACASGPGGSGGSIFSLPGSAPAREQPLAEEQQWLQKWFSGTPVQIDGADDGSLLVAVPLEHSFEVGRSRVKPALAAVLDKVATSLRRQAGSKIEIAAPAGDSSDRIAAERGMSMRDYLVGRGVRPTRIAYSANGARSVEMTLRPPPPVIERLEDLPATSAGKPAKVPVKR